MSFLFTVLRTLSRSKVMMPTFFHEYRPRYIYVSWRFMFPSGLQLVAFQEF